MKTVKRILRLRSQGLSMQAIATAMNTTGVATKQGGTWHPVTIQKVLKIHTEAVVAA
jgi:site-specific DNA recombinase